jgi:hypothetical protein
LVVMPDDADRGLGMVLPDQRAFKDATESRPESSRP